MFHSYVTLPEGMKKCYVLTQQNMYLIIYIVLALLAFGKGHRDKKTTHLNHLALSVPATRTCILNGSPGCITISYLWNIANWDAWVGWWLLPFQQLKENQPPNWQSEMLLRRKIPPVPTPQRKTGNKTPGTLLVTHLVLSSPDYCKRPEVNHGRKPGWKLWSSDKTDEHCEWQAKKRRGEKRVLGIGGMQSSLI